MAAENGLVDLAQCMVCGNDVDAGFVWCDLCHCASIDELKSALAGLLSYAQQLELLVYPDDGSAHHPAITAASNVLCRGAKPHE